MIVGLTGGIGSGKSAAANFFEQLGVTVIDADIASRKVVEPNSYGLQKIVEHFGDKILNTNDDGNSPHLNRMALRNIIFSNEDERQWLNQLLHPLIKQWMDEQIQDATSAYAIKVIPLLVEGKLVEGNHQQQVDRILVIESDPSLQSLRVQSRDNISNDDVKNIMSSQASNNERDAISDDKIINNSSLQDLELDVEKMHNKYLKLVATHSN